MKYVVFMKVEGRIEVEVEAGSAEEAFEAADDLALDADLSTMEVVDLRPVNAVDEKGELTDY